MVDPAGGNEAAPAEQGFAWRAIVLVIGLLAIFSLLSFGSRGNEIAGILSAGFAFMTLILTFFPPGPVERILPEPNIRDHFLRWWRNASALARVANIAVGVLVSCALAWATFQLSLGPPLEAAYLARIEGGDDLTNTTQATIRFPTPTPNRDHLGITLTIDPTSQAQVIALSLPRCDSIPLLMALLKDQFRRDPAKRHGSMPVEVLTIFRLA